MCHNDDTPELMVQSTSRKLEITKCLVCATTTLESWVSTVGWRVRVSKGGITIDNNLHSFFIVKKIL
jgi:hypothetical protein